jgi:trigger factor
MRATSEAVEGNRVRLSVEIDEAEVDKVVEATARRLASQLRVPGFRPGRVPRPVLEARLGGATALRQQAISDALPDLYARAVSDTELDPIAAPEFDVVSGEESGPLTFDALVEVRPTVSLPGYQGLAVTLPSLEVTEEEIDAQVDRIREQSGELSTVGRGARDGDYATIDIHGTRAGGEPLDLEDYLYEVGSGSDLPGLDEQLRGAKAGDILQFSAALGGTENSGEPAIPTPFRVLVKEVKEKVLPEATDEWASEASEFSTVAELRADLRSRLEQVKLVQAQLALRERALEALISLVEDDPPESLVETEVRERLHDLGHRLEARRLTLEQFLEASGRDGDSLLEELRVEALRDVRVDLALRALADAEEIEVSDEELDQAVQEIASQAHSAVDEVHERLDRSGRLAAVRSGRRKAKALSWLLDNVELIDENGKPVSREDLRSRAGADESQASDQPETQSSLTISVPPETNEHESEEDVQDRGTQGAAR